MASTITYNGAWVVETFTGTYTQRWTVPQGVTSIKYLLVGGGGRGGVGPNDGSVRYGGGGGGGEVVYITNVAVTPGGYLDVFVGPGGSSSYPNGYSSYLGPYIDASGGGAGGNGGSNGNSYGAGSGGGAGSTNSSTRKYGGTGTYKGGDTESTGGFISGGGGGAGGAGIDGSNAYLVPSTGSNGGVGFLCDITGTSTYYGGGGGGGGKSIAAGQAIGGLGGGGNGATSMGTGGVAGTNGTAGTGGGGGGGSIETGIYVAKNGGSGIVIVSYLYTPLVTTQDVTLVNKTIGTGNGTITNIGGSAVTRRGFCYKVGTSGDPTTSDSVIYNDGSFSAGAYSQVIPFGSSGTNYRVRSYAVNSSGTSYGTTVQTATEDVADGSAGVTSTTSVPYFSTSSASLRGGIVAGGKLYIVIGENVLKVTSSGVVSSLGTITTTTGNVFMASNGIEVLIVDSTVYGHYITISTDTLNNVTDGDFQTSSSCTFMDGFFVVTKTSTGRIYKSALYSANTWDPLDFTTVEGNPDNLLRCFHANNNLWLFGNESVEVYYNSGATFPFERIPGALIEDGLVGSAAVCFIKDQFYFLSNKLEVLRNVGYQREKISTIHVDKEIQSYTTVSDAIAYEYRAYGNIFFVLTFPTQDKTWVYDITTNYWHEWSSYKSQGVATYGRHRGVTSFYFNSKWVVGDYINGNLYYIDINTYTDNGELIPRTRRAQIVNKERLNVIHHEIELDFEMGVGTGGTSNPLIYIRWSDDGVKTWSNYYAMSIGMLGEYTVRARKLRMGKSRNRVYEITTSEPVKFVLAAAYVKLEELMF